MKNFIARALVALFCVLPLAAHAQSTGTVVSDCAIGVGQAYTVGSTRPMTLLNTGQACVSGSISASLAGFTPGSTGTPISVTTGGVTGTLPAGAVVVATNVGTTNPAYCKLGASATTSDQYISPGGGWFAFTVGAATQLTCITGSSTTTVNMVGGAGLPTGTGGGSGSGGGGGSVTQGTDPWLVAGKGTAGSPSGGVVSIQGVGSGTAVPVSGTFWQATQPISAASASIAAGALAAGAGVDGWDLTVGAKGDSACGTATGTCSLIALMKYLNTNITAAIPAGTNLIGDVNLRQGGTALSTTNGAYFNQLQGNAVLSATNPSFARLTDGTNAVVTDPCAAVAKTNATGTQTTGTQIIAGTSAKKTYICSFSIIAGAAEIFNIIAGTGSVCATGTSVVLGSSTAANGMSLAANGGLTLGNGAATVIAATAANADNVCITQSGSNRITWQLTYVQL